MKRYLIAALLIFTFSNASFADELENSPVMNVTNPVFRSSLTDLIPDNDNNYSGYDYNFQGAGGGTRTYREINPDNMPFFKQMRLRITNKLCGSGEEESVENPDEENVTEVKESPLKKVKFWKKKNKNVLENQSDLVSESDLTSSIQSETQTDLDISDETMSLTGGVNEQVTEKQLTLDAEFVTYDDETGDMVATGRPILYLPPQNVKIVADKMTYNEDSNVLKGIGNVVVYKDGMPTKGDYLEVDMNEETMIMDNMETKTESMITDAKKAIQKDGLIILNDGNFHSDESQIYRLASRMVGPQFQNMIVDPDAQALIFGNPEGNNFKLDIKSIFVEARKNHDVIKAKEIKFYHKDKYLFTWPSLTAYTNKERDYFEASYPELGSRRKLGMYVGPGFVFGGPAGSVIKVIPFLNYKSKFGFGGALKYHNTYNTTEMGYGSANDIFFLRGVQRLDDNVFLHYAVNSYLDEWFLGSRMPKWMAEVYYDKSFVNKDFLAKGMDLRFRHRAGFGMMQDDDRSYYGEHIDSSEMTTTRTRYMAELAQSFYNYKNIEKRLALNVSLLMQGSAALYGTGDTQFIGRVGPSVHLQYKNWMQDVGYLIAGYSDETPLPRYDTYRYGHQSVYLTEALRLNKYFSVGWSGNINLSDDAPNGKMFQENRFIVAFGPDDFKISLGYDFVRQTTYFGFNVAFDTKGTSIKYGKMEIKNPEKLGKNANPEKSEEERKLAFSPASKKSDEVQTTNKKSKSTENEKSTVLKYAEVIEIEDPDKESIQ